MNLDACATCMQIVTPADKFVASVQQDDSIVRGACNIVAAMFQNVPLHAVDAAVGNEKIAEALQSLAQITVDLIRLGGASVDNCTDWQGVCTGTISHPPPPLVCIVVAQASVGCTN